MLVEFGAPFTVPGDWNIEEKLTVCPPTESCLKATVIIEGGVPLRITLVTLPVMMISKLYASTACKVITAVYGITCNGGIKSAVVRKFAHCVMSAAMLASVVVKPFSANAVNSAYR
jgi:hypothetical protein